MLGISFSEFIVVIVVMVVLIRPADLPKLVKLYRVFINKFFTFKEEISNTVTTMHNEIMGDNQDENNKVSLSKHSYILGKDGKLHKSYDIRSLDNIKHNNSTVIPLTKNK